jgi:hypothetical protein
LAAVRGDTMRAPRGILLVVMAIAGLSCTDESEPAPQPAQAGASATPEVSPLVGEWKRVTTCDELVALLDAYGLGSRAPQAIEGNGWVGGTLEQLAKKDDPCEGAVPREHSHFFTASGAFGSLDWRGEQVDEGTYEVVDDRTFTLGDATFHFEIRGDAIRFEPVLPDTSTGFDCVWMIAVASPGYAWERVTSAQAESAIEGAWDTDSIRAAEIRAVLLDAGFTREDAAQVIDGTRTFRFELRFEGEGYELTSSWDGKPVGVLEAGGYRITESGRLLLDTGDIGDTYLFAPDLEGDLLSLELIRASESGTAEDRYVHSYFTTAFFTGHAFTRSG